jgi:hypothetical protein
MDNKFPSSFKRMKDPDKLFDLICVANYFAGTFDRRMPVDENREVFERIKKLIKKQG